MKVIVPLAGPDLVHPAFGPKPLHAIEGEPLLAAALGRRPWVDKGEVSDRDYIFVLREGEALGVLRAYLAGAFPWARIVTVSSRTRGALFSAMAGLVFVGESEPLCIDLADILYDWPDYAADPFSAAGLGAIAPSFVSQDERYSYLRFEGERVVEAAEKHVISDRASAGTYLFRDIGAFLRAAAHVIDQGERWQHRGAHFVCPVLNGILAAGWEVAAPLVTDVRSPGLSFKQQAPAIA